MSNRTDHSMITRQRLLASASGLVLGLFVTVAPANAQMARMQAAIGAAPTITSGGASAPTISRSARMNGELASQTTNRAAIQSMRALVTEARAAALAATRTQPVDGLAAKGLNPAVTKPVDAVDDATGLATWQGALMPTQTVDSSGNYTVTVKQTDSRALLSWNSFDIGAKTTLVFNQKQNGKAMTDWVALNRVVDPNASPTTILGRIKADGTVLVLNRNGVIFGNGAQVNTHSLLVSTLEIGNYAKDTADAGDGNHFTGLTLKERNTAYLENGLLGASATPNKFTTMLTSSMAGTGTYDTTDPNAAFASQVEGSVVVDRGANLSATDGGFLIMTAPTITNDGTLSASQGQVSLQAGRAISYAISTGDTNGIDPDIRGLILRSTTETAGSVVNSGLIEVPRGYISLGADLTGSVTNSGLLSSTTSVSRNGTISLTAGKVTLAGGSDTAHAGGISILEDTNGETVPQGTADEPPVFKTSRIDIGGMYVAATTVDNPSGILGAATVQFGKNSLLLAPSAKVSVGGRASEAYDPKAYLAYNHDVLTGSVTVASGAQLDVSGIKDVQLDASRNSVMISPLKGNELRDTPNYRDVKTDGSFTLNGATVYVDPRLSGVRADGVKWVGSPLIEAGSAISQIGVGAAELMTKGGSITLAVRMVTTDAADPATSPLIRISKSAVLDFSGGWTHYNAGWVRTTRLIQADGTLVDIAKADPNGDYIGIADGYDATQTKFGVTDTYSNRALSGARYDAAYDQGSDAGGLIVRASTATIDGTLHGDAFAGEQQILRGTQGTAHSAIANDPRKLQATGYELPSGGFVRIGSFSGKAGADLGGDIIVRGDNSAVASTPGAFVLSDTQLSDAGLSALTLQTSGAVTFASGSSLTLANGGALTVDAGRTITFDGSVKAAAGSIAARTYELNGTVLFSSIARIGSPFTAVDDIKSAYAADEKLPSLFDIAVGGTLDVAGLWSNDFVAPDAMPTGKAFTSGGSISLTVAPKVLVGLGDSLDTAHYAADLSGSIVIADGALLNVSSGGYVSNKGVLDLTAKGGNISLIDETTYASLSRTDAFLDSTSTTDFPIGGENQSVTFSSYFDENAGKLVLPALVVQQARSQVRFSASNFKGFSFGGGGIFKLVAPEVTLGSTKPASGAWLGLDFLQKTGFGGLDIAAWHSRTFNNLFTNGVEGNSAFFDTTQFVIHKGETLNLSQVLLPAAPDPETSAILSTLATGSDVTVAVGAAIPADAWDQKAATLKLGGLSELVVEKGGAITGAAGATITTAKLLNQGTIRITGGSIIQRADLPEILLTNAIGVRDAAHGGNGLDDVLGGRTQTGNLVQYDETALSKVGTITNHDLFSKSGGDRTVYFLGAVDGGTGIDLAAGSVTDLSGGVVFNPRALVLAGGHRQLTGTLYAGGTISAAASFVDSAAPLFSNPVYGGTRYQLTKGGSAIPYAKATVGQKIEAETGATIDLRGASATFDEQTSAASYTPTFEWSNGGTLSAMAGGSLGGATILATGGSDQAEGGTLEWLNPTFTQRTNALNFADDLVSADQIMRAGFSTVVARGGLGLDGNLSLKLGKAFILASADAVDSSPQERDYQVAVTLASNGRASIAAPYIRLSSKSQSAPSALTTSATAGSITFSADNIDLVGGLGFAVPGTTDLDGHVAGSVRFVAADAVRFNGVAPAIVDITKQSGLTGSVISTGDIAFTAAQVYATTGTGNLQQLLEDRRNGTSLSTARPYLVAALADNGTVSFASNGATTPAVPYSAGSWVRILGANIEQNGVLRAPLGLLEIGSATSSLVPGSLNSAPATASIVFGAGSITSVSGAGLNVPYGQTTDLTEYYFTPNVNSALTVAPVGEMVLDGASIDVAKGAKIDGQGGGDVFAYEFVSGTGGSRDVLSRFNGDSFSSNAGLQYADGRQVYAILPVSKAGEIAAYDPLYSADYGSTTGDLYGRQAGRTVHLEGGAGIAAGDYLLLPAHYALLPGAMRLVENVGSAAAVSSGAAQQLDGSVLVAGTFGTAGTGYTESTRRSFTVMSSDVFKSYSKIVTTSGTTDFANLADKNGLVAPRSPLDAARFVIRPGSIFNVDGTFAVDAATGGKGAQFDIAASAIEIRNALTTPADGVLQLTASTIANLNANSLLLGGVRTDNADGTTALEVIAHDLTVGRNVSLALPEVVFAVGGEGSRLVVSANAKITATGTLADDRSGNYVVSYNENPVEGSLADNTAVGALLRVSRGPDRLVTRAFDPSLDNAALASASLRINGDAVLSGTSVALNSSGAVVAADSAAIDATNIVFGSSRVSFTEAGIGATLAAKLAAADRLTLQSARVITLGDTLPSAFNTLVIEAPGVASDGANVTINAKSVRLSNTGADRGGCGTAVSAACGNTDKLTIRAGDIALGDGTFRVYGFDGGVTLDARNGLYVEGKGALAIDDASAPAYVSLTLKTPFIADRASTDAADVKSGGAQYDFLTTGRVLVDGTGRKGAPTTVAPSAGTLIAFGSADATVRSLTISNATIRASAGAVSAYAKGNIALDGTAAISAPGFSTTIGTKADGMVAVAGGGTITLQSLVGNVSLGEGTSLTVDNGIGAAGTLNLIAAEGTVALGGSLDAGIAAGKTRQASILLDGARLEDGAGNAFDFANFVKTDGRLFQGDVQVRTGTGNLALKAGEVLKASSVKLVADAGTITIGGTIDTSGDDVSKLKMTDAAYTAARVNGGDIALYGGHGVSLGDTAALQATTSGYADGDSRQAKGGNITLGIASDNAAITVAKGATIDVSATRPGDRFVALSVKDANTGILTTAYTVANGDLGGTVTFRAPIVNDTVDLRQGGKLVGASTITLDAFKRFDLDAIAASGDFAGITRSSNGTIHLDAADTSGINFLTDTTTVGALPEFVRNFAITLKDGGSLAGYRVRPDMQLSAAGSIVLDSNINLGAGTITDYDAALNDGLLTESPLGADANGNTRYEVVAGKESELFAKYVDMTYRVGGKVTGEAGYLTVRAGGNLTVANSISDGFFAFHDKTDADYINYQLGGGDRTYHPGVLIDCAAGGFCDNTLPSYSRYTSVNRRPADDQMVHIDLTAPGLGLQSTPTFIHSPYSASANEVAANGTGNGIGIGELFPLVDGKAVNSSDIRLVAGAGLGAVDPTSVDRSKRGSVIVAGEKSYDVVATQGTASIGGGIQIGIDDGFGNLSYGNAGDFLNGVFADFVNPTKAADLYTRLDWGTDTTMSDEARAAAIAYFASDKLITEDGQVVGVYASLGDVTKFLAGDFGAAYGALVNDQVDTSVIEPPVSYLGTKAYYRPVVRTGNGSIAVSAAGNIDLVGTPRVTYRNVDSLSRDDSDTRLEDAFDTGQVGGSAIYTAGTRLATFGLGNKVVLQDFSEKLNYIPSTQGLLDTPAAVTGNGGNVALVAGLDVIGRRDIWSETFLNDGATVDTLLPGYDDGISTFDVTRNGSASQRWRVGTIGLDTEIAIVPQLFSSGVGALSGGDVSVRAGRDVADLTIALDNSATTSTTTGGSRALVTSAAGNLTVIAGRDLTGGQFDIAQGIGRIAVGRAVTAAGASLADGSYDNQVDAPDTRNLLRLRVSDATVALTARGTVDLGGIGALGATQGKAAVEATLNSAGFFSEIAGVDVATVGKLTLVDNRTEQRVAFTNEGSSIDNASFLTGYVLPPSLALTSVGSDLALGNGLASLLYASRYGQLSLVSGGDISNFALSMSDANRSDLPGVFSIARFDGFRGQLYRLNGLGFSFASVVGTTDDATLRLYHDRNVTHAGDTRPATIFASGSIENVQLSLAKSARVNAGGNIVNFYYEGQNIAADDVTSVIAGGDITATTALPALDSVAVGRPYVGPTNFILGGPGTLLVQAGRDLGPFLNSATVAGVSYAGGIRTIGNEANPWLSTRGADVYALFGVSHGADYDALRSTYLDPANLAKLDGDLFVQVSDAAGNQSPDRTRPIYAPKLAQWLKDNAPAVFAQVFGTAALTASDAKLATLAYANYATMYAQFVSQVPEIQQRQFLIKDVYFGEIAAPANPNGPSSQQFVRGYRAIQTLFPATAGYTDNLSTFQTDSKTVSVDHPLGEPTKKLVNGQPAQATRIVTGNVDLRLATIETARGGDVTLMGPGGNFIAGSVVRTSEQAARKSTPYGANGLFNLRNGYATTINPVGIDSIPIGYEGVLTLRGGAIRSFTDGDFRLNQSRLFTLSGGDITMWSSNGDLNAGQGPKTASSFPPVTLRFTPNGTGEVNSAGSVAGAGIAALQPAVSVAPSSVTLLAPVGTVDAGDAGVRASGDVFVAAARVANADNFKVGGVAVGVPSSVVAAAPSTPASASAAATATAAQAGAQEKNAGADRQSIIRVDVLGYVGGGADDCPSGHRDANGQCVS